MYRYTKLFSLLIAVSLVCGQESSSDVFFLDLGIVIKPKTGTETVSRAVTPPIDDANAKVSKIEGSTIYMATSSEMLASLDRINEQIRVIEESLKSKITSLEKKNRDLKTQVRDLNQRMESEFSNVLTYEESNSKPPIEIPVPLTTTAFSTPAIEDLPIETDFKHNKGNITGEPDGFDEKKYIDGVIAYQREDYELCLKKFNQLHLDRSNRRTVSNILYWIADAHQQLGQYDQALQSLEKLSRSGYEQQMDDMLVQKGLIYQKIGSKDKAQKAFTLLVDSFPESEYVALAQLEINKNIIVR